MQDVDMAAGEIIPKLNQRFWCLWQMMCLKGKDHPYFHFYCSNTGFIEGDVLMAMTTHSFFFFFFLACGNVCLSVRVCVTLWLSCVAPCKEAPVYLEQNSNSPGNTGLKQKTQVQKMLIVVFTLVSDKKQPVTSTRHDIPSSLDMRFDMLWLYMSLHFYTTFSRAKHFNK